MTAGDLSHRIRELADGLGVEYGLEPSMKLAAGRCLANRFLLGFHKRQLGPDPRGRIVTMVREIGMPDVLEAELTAAFGEADLVHLGFEEGTSSCVCKVYLEFAGRLRVQPRPSGPLTLFLGFKWQVAGGLPHVTGITRYVCHPMLPREAILENVEQIYGNRASNVAAGALKRLLDDALQRVAVDEILYLDVDETSPENPRRSFDLNVYRAGFRVGDLEPSLRDICHAQGGSAAELEAWLSQIQGERLGHVSGGIDRGGRDFFTVYYGVKRVAPTRGGG